MTAVDTQRAKFTGKRRERRQRGFGTAAAQVLILIVLLASWQFGVSDSALPYFSRPTQVGARLYDLLTHHDIYRHMYVTLLEIAMGYALGAALAFHWDLSSAALAFFLLHYNP